MDFQSYVDSVLEIGRRKGEKYFVAALQAELHDAYSAGVSPVLFVRDFHDRLIVLPSPPQLPPSAPPLDPIEERHKQILESQRDIGSRIATAIYLCSTVLAVIIITCANVMHTDSNRQIKAIEKQISAVERQTTAFDSVARSIREMLRWIR